MALSLYDAGVIARDPDFQLRVAMSAYRVAHEVINEGDVEGHPLRLNLARSVISQDISTFGRYATMVVAMPEVYQSDVTRQADIPDEKIESYLESMWNDIAGYAAGQTVVSAVQTADHSHDDFIPPTMTVHLPS